MSRNPRRLFKRPRTPRQWPVYVYLLISLLVLAAAAVVWLVILVRPGNFPPTDEAHQWAAEAAIIGGGALFFAVVATTIAVVAYINSTEKPSLRLEAAYPGRDEPLAINWNNSQPDESGNIISTGKWPSWSLSLRLHNDGPVAARFVAIQVNFGEGAKLGRIPFAPSALPQQPWQAPTDQFQESNDMRWEGGADAVVHPASIPTGLSESSPWVYRVPQFGSAYLVLSGPQPQTEFTFEVEVVADDVPAFKHTYVIKVPRDK